MRYCCTSWLLGGPVTEVWLSALTLNAATHISALNAVLWVKHPLRGSLGCNRHMQPVCICFHDMHIMQKGMLLCEHFLILYSFIFHLNSFDRHILWFSSPFIFFLTRITFSY